MSAALIDLGEERAGAGDRGKALITAAIIIVCCFSVIPVISVPLGTSYPLFAIVIALSISAIVVTSVLLWAQARVTRSIPLSVLSVGYALTGATMLPYMLMYRGLWPQVVQFFSADDQSSAWLYFEWHTIFVCSAIAYFVVRGRYTDRPQPDAATFSGVRRRLVFIGAAIYVCTVPGLIWIDNLPDLALNGHFTPLFKVFGIIVDIGAVIAIAISYRAGRYMALLDLWLSIACFSMFADITMTMFSRQFAVGWYVSRVSILVAATSVLFVLLFQVAKLYAQLTVTAERLRNESLTDALTGLANRRRFDEQFSEVMRDLGRAHRPVALLLIDIDNFKTYNDTFGHQAGDDCLREVASILHQNVGRARDLVARTGGEEIAILMPEVDMRGALVVAERIRAAVAAAAIPQGRGAIHPIVTISVGASATHDPSTTTNDALVAAGDRALYRAKSYGRNQVVEAGDGALLIGVPDA